MVKLVHVRLLGLVTLLAGATVLAGCPGTERLVLRGGEYVDVETGALVSFGGIVVDGGRITQIIPPGDPLPRGTDIGVAGRYVVPGFWDLHTHVAFADENETNFIPANLWDSYRGSRYKRQEHLVRGITTIRDPGGGAQTLALARKVARGDFIGPRVLGAGKVITSVEGHPIQLLGAGGGPLSGVVIDLATIQVSTAAEARAGVRENDEAGAHFIKVVHTSALLRPGEVPPGADVSGVPSWALEDLPPLTPEILAAVAAEAQARGLHVTAHVDRVAEAMEAVQAGFEMIEHPISPAADPADDLALINEMATRSTCWDPTLLVLHAFAPDLLPSRGALVNQALVAGVPIVSGSDTGFMPDVAFGEGHYAELQLLGQHAGMSPLQVLQATTIQAARCAGLGAESGQIAEGFRADLVVLDANPLDSVEALHPSHVRHVVAAGELAK